MAGVGSIAFMRSVAVLAAAVALSGLGGEASAEHGFQLATLRIVDRDTSQDLRIWRHHGRLYVVGQPGERYSLRVANNTDDRILAVMSVDGVNIVSGETAGYDQRGYVLAPHQSVNVNGWRKSTTEVAAFSFSALSQSYAARTGRPLDVGVIGMAVFKEKPQDIQPPPGVSDRRRWGGPLAPPPPVAMPAPPLPLPPVRAPIPEAIAPPRPVAPAPISPAPSAPPVAGLAAQASPAPRVAMVPQSEKLGTAHGAREWSVVNLVSFERATPYPAFVQQIEYDSYADLAAIGVVPRVASGGAPPHSFPSSTAEVRYVPDPPDAR